MSKIKILFMVIVTLTLLLLGCDDDVGSKLNGDEPIEYEEAEGGEISLPLRMVSSLNPLLASSEDLHHFNKLIYEGLFELDEKLEPIESLAKNYSISASGTAIELELREGVKWHDGNNLRAEDVVFTIQTIRSAYESRAHSQNLSPLYGEGGVYDISKISDIRATSDMSVRIEFNNPSADILEYLTMPILPSHLSNDIEQAMTSEDYLPIGTGPYSVESVDMFKQVDLVRNENYWKQMPNIERIRGRILRDRTAGRSAFDSGRINAIYDRGDEWEEYTENDRIEISEFTSNRQLFISPNFRKELISGESGLKIREAISLAIDREHILKEIYLDYGYLSDTIINPNSWLSDSEDFKEGNFNLDRAKEILVELGYQEGSDGYLVDQEGEVFRLRVTALPRDARRYRAIEQIVTDIEQLGILIERDYSEELLADLEEDELENRLLNFKRKLMSDDYDLAIIEYEQSYLPDISQLLDSSYVDISNYSAYRSEELDTLFKRLGGIRSKDEKKGLYGELENYLKEQLPLIPIIHSEGALVSYRRINGDLNPNYFSIYREIERWFVPKEFQLIEE